MFRMKRKKKLWKLVPYRMSHPGPNAGTQQKKGTETGLLTAVTTGNIAEATGMTLRTGDQEEIIMMTGEIVWTERTERVVKENRIDGMVENVRNKEIVEIGLIEGIGIERPDEVEITAERG